MIKKITPSRINGNSEAPPSKSFMQRVVAAGLCSPGRTVIKNPSFCQDSRAALSIAGALGAMVEIEKTRVIIKGVFPPAAASLDCNESGLCLRMFTPIAALSSSQIILTGRGSLKNRPLSMPETAFKELGVSFHSANGFIPVSVTGPLKGGKVVIDGSESSQFLTGLLMALPLAENDSEVMVANLRSKPYIDMTLAVLHTFGITISHEKYQRFIIPGNQRYQPRELTIEGDWSSAAFLLVAGAVGGEVTVKNLTFDSCQADKGIVDVLKQAGGELRIKPDSIGVGKKTLRPFSFNATDSPDLFPPLVALGAHCHGVSTITGVHRLKNKESDRAFTLQQEFGNMGIRIEIENDDMKVFGGKVRGGDTFSHGDHRIAMALSVAAIGAENPVTLNGAETVKKSYEHFFRDLEQAGLKID